MARSHHRKNHKEHLKQFKHSHDTATSASKARTKASSVFTIAGALVGFAVSYFATQGSIIWVAVGLLTGAGIGYMIGKKVDAEKV